MTTGMTVWKLSLKFVLFVLIIITNATLLFGVSYQGENNNNKFSPGYGEES